MPSGLFRPRRDRAAYAGDDLSHHLLASFVCSEPKIESHGKRKVAKTIFRANRHARVKTSGIARLPISEFTELFDGVITNYEHPLGRTMLNIPKKKDRFQSPEFLNYIRSLPCCLCNKPATPSHMISKMTDISLQRMINWKVIENKCPNAKDRLAPVFFA